MPRSRPKRLRESKRRLEEELKVECEANADYEAWRGRGISADGHHRMAPGTVKPFTPPVTPEGKVNTTDPDSRLLKARRGFVQGYNAQAVVNEQQIVIAAEIRTVAADFGHLEPMVAAEAAQYAFLIAGAQYYVEGRSKDPATIGFRALDPQTFQITLANPAPYFLGQIAFYPFYPLHRATLLHYVGANGVEAELQRSPPNAPAMALCVLPPMFHRAAAV